MPEPTFLVLWIGGAAGRWPCEVHPERPAAGVARQRTGAGSRLIVPVCEQCLVALAEVASAPSYTPDTGQGRR